MKFNNKLFALAAFLLYTLGFTASAGLDIKYHKKIADQIWSMNDPTFNPAVRIPDSVAAENSAVIISWADDIDVEHDVQNTIYTLSGLTNRIKRVNISRKMIKLFDQSAIDRYSEFEFGEKEQLKIMESLLIYDLQTSFGARIHKPDGRIIEVNLADAIETGDGKKGKDNKTYKIAIPGLEPGDVFEYFRYKEVMAESMSLDPQDFKISDKYPILNRRIELSVNPEMTVEYKCYNGVPDLVREPNGNRRTASLHLTDIPAVNFSKYVMEYRQLPFLRVQYLNNTQREYLSVNSRRGGLYGNIFPEKIMSELRDYMSQKKTNNTVAGKAIKIVKDNYLKANPEASKREIAEAAWLALHYQDQTGKSDDETSSGQFERALIFGDILRRLKLYGDEEIGLGVINPRNDVPTGEISAWDESRFVVRTPDGIYFMPQNLSLAQGEMPGHYQGETAALYFGDRKTWTNKTLANEYKVPQLKASDNGFVSTDTVTISDDKVIVNSVLKLTGGVKSLYAFFTETPEWTAEVEDYFNIPDNKRYRDKSYDRAGRTTELEKTSKRAEKPIMEKLLKR